MDSDTWARLSEWHNAWLSAPSGERDRLRRDFVAAHPALEVEVDALVGTGQIAPGFLETPALALAIDDLVNEGTPLAAGTLLGPYRIVTLLARGGMGEVYRATDTRLGRDVAIKVVSGGPDADPRLVERFIREARVTASLDRPNIVRVFDVGMHDGRPFLVMEFLQGETLRHRLARGRLPAADAVRVALDVARGLTAAHAAGLIHHDLKPENLFLTVDGPAKILDFGIATLAPVAPAAGADLTATAGLLIGTAGYLAPEKVLGETTDVRADLFALGAVLFEMLTGRRAFAREHAIDTLYAVLHDEVPPLTGEPEVPAGVSAVVSRLLQKAPAARFQSAADLAWTLEHVGMTPAGALPTRVEPRQRARWVVPAVAAALAAATVIAAWSLRPAAAPRAVTPALARFTWQLPDGLRLRSNPIVAPDGRRIAFVGGTLATGSQLYVRSLSALDIRAIAGTQGARQPFWSPDGARLGYFANGKLLTVAIEGGAPVPLADAPDPRGGTWSTSGLILFAPELRDASLMRVPAAGGVAVPVTTIDAGAGDIAHRWPSFLPDGVHFLYQVMTVDDRRRGVYVGSLAEPDHQGPMLFPSESGAVFVTTATGAGAILTARRDGVEARGFNPGTLRLVGDVQRLATTAAAATPREPAMLDASTDVLAVADTGVPWGSEFISVSSSGTDVQVLSGQELGGWPRLSADGRQLLRASVDPDRGNPDLWVRDLERGTQLRITTSRDYDVSPVWSPDERHIAYRSGSVGTPELAIVSADGSGPRDMRPCPGRTCDPTDWSSDGRLLVNADDGIWLVPADKTQPPTPFVTAGFVERDGRFSPDGQWVAYVSEEAGHPEVLIRSLSGPSRRVVVSNAGGDQPVWKRDGSSIFYVDHQLLLQRVAVHRGPNGTLTLGRPAPVNVPPFARRHFGTGYDVSADGTRVFLPRVADARDPNEITIVLGWRALLH